MIPFTFQNVQGENEKPPFGIYFISLMKEVKIGIFGNKESHKTMIAIYFTRDFNGDYDPDCDKVMEKEIEYEGQKVTIKIADIVEASDPGRIKKSFYDSFAQNDGFIFVYSPMHPDDSFNQFRECYSEVCKRKGKKRVPCIIAAHLFHEYENDPVLAPISEGEAIKKELECEVVEIDTRSDNDVNELFNKLFKKIMKKKENHNRNCQIQ